MDQFYVTTPIYYANDKPHVGHAYTTIAADVLARYWRKKIGTENVFFLTGTDEHGQKIAQAAEKAGRTPKEHVDNLVPRFQNAWKLLNVQYDIFMRTTERAHIEYAQQFLKVLKANDDIYKGEYEGFYCVACEKYITETELVDGKFCPDHPTLPCEYRKEENYFFRLTKYIPRVIETLEKNQMQVLPEKRKNEVLARLKGEVRDLSISRPSLFWGVPVPWDEGHTVYVWTEALLNYLSALEIKAVPSFWPADVHLMGKEILWFHAAIWPALLLAAGKELPKTVFAHGWFTFDGAKMSKSLGNVIDPVELVDEWGTDAVRYFLLSAVKFGEDGDLQPSQFNAIYEADLANSLGNLLNRTVTLIDRSGIKIEPGVAPSCANADKAIEELRLDDGLKAIWEIVRNANKGLEEAKPWELIKGDREPFDKAQGRQVTGDSQRRDHLRGEGGALEQILTTAYRELETIAAGLAPYLPETSEKIFDQLKSGKAEPLFPRQDKVVSSI